MELLELTGSSMRISRSWWILLGSLALVHSRNAMNQSGFVSMLILSSTDLIRGVSQSHSSCVILKVQCLDPLMMPVMISAAHLWALSVPSSISWDWEHPYMKFSPGTEKCHITVPPEGCQNFQKIKSCVSSYILNRNITNFVVTMWLEGPQPHPLHKIRDMPSCS